MRARRLIPTLLVAICLFQATALHASPAQGPHELLIVVSIDGCRWDYLAHANTPNVDAIRANGSYVVRCTTVFPSLTRAGHASIMTGAYPLQHGVAGNVYYDEEAARESRYLPEVMSAETILEVAIDYSMKSVSVAFPMSKGSSVRIDRESVPKYISNAIGTMPIDPLEADEWRMEAAILALEEELPAILLIHFGAVDKYGHEYGPLSSEAMAAVENVDSQIGGLIGRISRLGLLNVTTLVITADHGMQAVDKGIPVRPLLYERGFSSYVVYDGRASYIYISDGDDPSELIEFLSEVEGVDEVITRDEFLDHNLPDWSTLVGDIFLSAESGYMFGEVTVSGMHGGLMQEDLRMVLILSGPTIPAGKAIWQASVVDIAPTVCQVLGIPPPACSVGSVLRDFRDPAPLEAEDRILLAEGVVEEISASYNTTMAEELLVRARSKFEDNDYNGAIALADEAIVSAQLSMNASEAMARAQSIIVSAEEEGRTKGLEEAVSLLQRADEAYNGWSYEEAIELAYRAVERAEGAKKPFPVLAIVVIVVVCIVAVGTLLLRRSTQSSEKGKGGGGLNPPQPRLSTRLCRGRQGSPPQARGTGRTV